jgi:hypothetical protein
MKKYIFLSYFAEPFKDLDKSSTSGLAIIE